MDATLQDRRERSPRDGTVGAVAEETIGRSFGVEADEADDVGRALGGRAEPAVPVHVGGAVAGIDAQDLTGDPPRTV
jgi:hypothetical protein